MSLTRWYKPELTRMGREGYQVVPCKDEAEANQVKELLKANNRCAQAGYAINREGKEVFFVLTKNKVKRGSKSV